MRELLEIVTKGSRRERRELAVLFLIFGLGYVTIYLVAWAIGGGP